MRKIIASALLAASVAAPAFPQEPPRSLTVEEAVALALEASPALHAAGARLEGAAARTRELEAGRLPSVQAGAGYSRLSHVPPFEVDLPLPPAIGGPRAFVISPTLLDQYAVQVNVQQPIFTGFRLSRTIEAARRGEQAAGREMSQDRADAAFAARTAAWNLFKAREVERLAAESAGTARAHLERVKSLLAQGLVTRNDLLRSEVQLSNAELQTIEAGNAVAAATAALDSLLGWPLETPVEIRTSAADVLAGLDEAARSYPELPPVLRKLEASRPDLLALRDRVKAAEAAVGAAAASRYPQVFATAGLLYMNPNPRLLPARNKFYGTWNAGLSVSYDLWNGGRAAEQTRQARALVTQAEDAFRVARDRAALEATQAWLELRRARERIAAAEKAMGQARENLREAQNRFAEGVALTTEVLDAETLDLQAKTAYAQALADAALAQARMRKAVGD